MEQKVKYTVMSPDEIARMALQFERERVAPEIKRLQEEATRWHNEATHWREEATRWRDDADLFRRALIDMLAREDRLRQRDS